MPDEAHLRERARAAVESGKIPARDPDRTWGGPGVGATCTICGLSVSKQQTELEIQFAHDEKPGVESGLDVFHVHVRCFAAWEFERKKASSP